MLNSFVDWIEDNFAAAIIWFMTFVFCVLVAFAPERPVAKPAPNGDEIWELHRNTVQKFVDGNVVCYVSDGNKSGGISCLRREN